MHIACQQSQKGMSIELNFGTKEHKILFKKQAQFCTPNLVLVSEGAGGYQCPPPSK